MTAVLDRSLEVVAVKNSNIKAKIQIPESLQILDDPYAKPAIGCGIFRVMTAKDGDKRVVWDSRDFNQITEAKAMFDELVAAGQVPYRVDAAGRATPEITTEFDPYVGECVFLPLAQICAG